MAQWGTPEDAAQRHREQQVRDQQFRQQQENNKRFADGIAARQAEQAKQKAAQDRTSAFIAGANGNTASGTKYSNYGSYLAGAASAGRDPHSGESYFSKKTSNPSYGNSGGSLSGKGVGMLFAILAVAGLTIWALSTFPDQKTSSRTSRATSTTTQPSISLKPFTHYVTTAKLNIRNGPSTQNNVVGSRTKGKCVRVVGNNVGKWVKVAVPTTAGNRVYYMHSGSLKRIGTGQSCR
ncbi:MAG: SH3 domain-containing protein [Tateyamaria sp.]|uniref:hypothetical protein n=1 Tax=Tateyamaria sp. TaxID=1929288 RepID=UPI00329CC233